MERFIRELHFGTIDPQAKSFKTHSQYGNAIEIISKDEELLTNLLREDF